MSGGNKVYIAVIGVGGVGKHFLSQLAPLTRAYPSLHPVLISRSTTALLGNLNIPLSLTDWEEELPASDIPPLTPYQILAFLRSLASKSILIDNTSSPDIAAYYPTFLSHGINIITPNKKAFSGSLSFWRAIFPSNPLPDHGLCYHESTVGAGLPILSTLRDLLATGDTVHRIEGVFSGTMSYLFNTFAPVDGSSGGGRWSSVVQQAKEFGFTEPDPRDDLNGLDVARKLVILARIVGLEVEGVDSFPVESLIPRELKDVQSGEAFLERLGEFDAGMEGVKEGAMKEGKVVRFVGSIDVGRKSLKVGLDIFDKGHPIAGLKGSDNIVSFYTERYGSQPLVVQGAGAGGAVTAMGVTADLIKVIQRIEK